MRSLPWLSAFAWLLLGCDSGGHTVAAGAIASGVGPAGATLKGPAGTQLEGLVVTVPAGALEQFVQVAIQPGTTIGLPDTESAGLPVRIQASPDPGPLLLPLSVTMPARMLAGFTEQGLLAAQRVRIAGPASDDTIQRLGIAADAGTIDPRRGSFTFAMQRLTDLEIRRATRRPDDAATLVDLGIAAFQPLTAVGTRQAGFLFRQALQADPLAGAALTFEALARLLTLLLDDADTTPDIDSVGEALRRLGVDLGARNLVERLLTLDTEAITVTLAPDAPNLGALVAFAERVLRPELLRALEQLARVPDSFTTTLTLPARFAPVPRTVDHGDVAALRAGIAGALALLDMLRGLDLDLDLSLLAAGATGADWSVDEVLARFPGLLALRRDTFPTAGQAAAEALALGDEAWRAILRQGASQAQHLVRVPATWSATARDLVAEQLRGLRDSLVGGGAQVLRQDGVPGSFRVDLAPLFRSLVVSPRALLPEFVRFVPTNALPDPTLAGVLPLMSRDEATLRAGLASRVTPPDATITVDGDPVDWPAAAEALRPRDPVGDVAGAATLAMVDGVGLWLARSATTLSARLELAAPATTPAPGVEVHYTVVLRELRPRSLGPRVELDLTAGTPPVAQLLVDGQVQGGVTVAGALAGTTVELAVALSDLQPFLAAGTPWLTCFATSAHDGARNLDASDQGRAVIVP